MSSVSLAVEPLSEEEARVVSRSRSAQGCLVSMVLLAVLAFFITLAFAVGSSSIGELFFMSAIALLVVGALSFLVHMFFGVSRDHKSNTKLVVKGKVVAVDRRFTYNGFYFTTIRVGEKFVASDPLYSPVPGYLSQVRVGDFIQISYLPHSRRTLSIVPA